MSASQPAPPTFRETVAALRRHQWKMIAFFLVIVSLATAITLLTPKAYRSEGKLLVRLGRENLAADPTATVGSSPVLAVQTNRENEINSAIEIMRSRVLIDRVISSIGGWRLYGVDEGTEVRYDKIVRLVNRSLGVDAVRKSNVIRVTYDAPTSELAQEVVERFVEYFMEEYIRLNRTPGGQEFLVEQTDQIRRRLRDKELELSRLKSDTGLASPVEQRAIAAARIGRLQDELHKVLSEMGGLEEEISQLRTQLANLPEHSVSEETVGIANQALDGMRIQLYTLQLKEQELSARFTADHPQLQQVRDQIVDAQRILQTEATDRPQKKTSIHRPHEEVRLQLVRQEPALAALRVKADLIRQQLADEQQLQRQQVEQEMLIVRLEREVKLDEANYQRYVDSLEQASIDRAMALEGKSNISIMQPATYELRPIKPQIWLNLGLAVMLGLLGAVATGILASSLEDKPAAAMDVGDVQLVGGRPVVAGASRFVASAAETSTARESLAVEPEFAASAAPAEGETSRV